MSTPYVWMTIVKNMEDKLARDDLTEEERKNAEYSLESARSELRLLRRRR